MHRARLGRTRQTNQPPSLEMRIPRLSWSRLIGPLTASLEMLDKTGTHVPIDLPVSDQGIPDGKIVRPSFQVSIQLSYQDRNRLKALMTICHFMQLLPLPLNRFLRREHIQIFPIAPFQIAVIPERVSQKVQPRSWFPQVPSPSLFPIDLQLELPFQPRFDELDGFRSHLLR